MVQQVCALRQSDGFVPVAISGMNEEINKSSMSRVLRYRKPEADDVIALID
jgi:hypothetical protein